MTSVMGETVRSRPPGSRAARSPAAGFRAVFGLAVRRVWLTRRTARLSVPRASVAAVRSRSLLDADGLFERIEAAGVEHVAFCHDPAARLRALVVIGSTQRGPALCGVRVHPYANADAAVDDGLRLAMAMTVKAAAADVRLGGGSVIVMADPADAARPEIRRLADSVTAVLAHAASSGTSAGDAVVRLARERLRG